jgi:hypothetical protein
MGQNPPYLITNILKNMMDPKGNYYSAYTSSNFDFRAREAGLYFRNSSQLSLFVDDLLPNKIYRISSCITSWGDYFGWNTTTSDEVQNLLIDKYNKLLDLYIISWEEYYYLRPSGLVSYRSEYIYSSETATNRKPFSPSNLFPDLIGIIGFSPTLSWDSGDPYGILGDPDGDRIEYDIYFGDSNPPTELLVKTFLFSVAVKDLEPSTNYYWWVQAREYGEEDNYGCSSNSYIATFLTGSS